MERYSIPEINMDKLEKKLTTIQNKCKKYGCTFNFERVGEEFTEEISSDGEKFTIKRIIVEVEGKAIINDWMFVATLEHTASGNIIKSAHADVEIPERFYNAKPYCEHCHTQRDRKDTYIVLNTKTNEFKQVGKSCLKDYTNGMDAQMVASFYSYFDTLEESENFSGCGRGESYYLVEELMHYGAEVINHWGYVKNGAYERSTADRVKDYYCTNSGYILKPERYRNEMQEVNFDIESDYAKEQVKACMEWIKEQPETSNYIHNLKAVSSERYIKWGNIALLVSIFVAHNRDLEYKAEKAQQEEKNAKSEYVGEIGNRIEFEVVEGECVTSWETQWGTTYIYKFIDKSGNVYTWKTSKCMISDEVNSITGTVKAHNEFRGCKQTELTRCKIK